MKIGFVNTFAAGGNPTVAPGYGFGIGSFEVTDTMISAAVVTVILLVFALVVRFAFIPRWNKSNSTGGFRMLLEGTVGMFQREAEAKTEHYSAFTAAWYFGASSLICVGTLFDLAGLRPPVSSLGQTLVLGLSTFAFVHVLGFVKKKQRRLLHYLNPITLITDAVVPFSMALRLFGSVFSGYLIMHLLYSAIPLVVPAVASIIFTLFHAFIQSYVFMLLSMSFIQEAIEIQPKAPKERKHRGAPQPEN
ncbi:MAG: F0F1 ATP synthase subunit A [Clostridiales bacterium]|jgi:F-type H+-transporting ATPase subunit a|nr:F0F1 ATP synthase subunit A [Clostridiales bacterium]